MRVERVIRLGVVLGAVAAVGLAPAAAGGA
jgi:hypothetical protein